MKSVEESYDPESELELFDPESDCELFLELELDLVFVVFDFDDSVFELLLLDRVCDDLLEEDDDDDDDDEEEDLSLLRDFVLREVELLLDLLFDFPDFPDLLDLLDLLVFVDDEDDDDFEEDLLECFLFVNVLASFLFV